MKGICPNCEKIRELEKINKTEVLKVKNENIEVNSTCFICKTCKSEFDDPKERANPVEEAYRIYRSKYEAIKEKFRGIKK